MADLNIVMEKLQGFDTADALADYFRDYGIIAQPRNARACAIAQFVRVETGVNGIVINTSALRIEDEDGCVTECIPHTVAMEDFVEKYDRGYYPDLIEAGYEMDIISENYDCCPECG